MQNSSLNLRCLLQVGLFAALTAVLSFVRIPLPFSPVPITGQTLGTMLAGLLLGSWAGALSQLIYVLVGLSGLPVFGGMAGPAVLAGPTGGYLVGMICGAFVVGALRGNTEQALRMFAGCLVGGILVVYIFGVWWLSRVAGLNLTAAVMSGAVPYLPGDVLKSLAAVGLALRLRPIMRSMNL